MKKYQIFSSIILEKSLLVFPGSFFGKTKEREAMKQYGENPKGKQEKGKL